MPPASAMAAGIGFLGQMPLQPSAKQHVLVVNARRVQDQMVRPEGLLMDEGKAKQDAADFYQKANNRIRVIRADTHPQ